MLIDGLTLTEKDGERELSANINKFRVWIRVQADVQLMESAEPFLAAGFLEALTRGGALKIESELGISKPLLSNIEVLQLIYRNWNSALKPVTLDCSTVEPRSPIPGVASMYSAGVDSTYTLLQHDQDITHMVRLFGLDFSETPEETAQIVEHDSAFAREIGKRYIPVRTNFRDYVHERKIDFPFY